MNRSFLLVPTLAAALLFSACGGSASPTAPSATSSLPGGASACAAINGGSASGVLGILNGAACSTDGASVVLLNMRDKNNGAIAACSGTVVGPRAVLTAAHCLQGDTALVKVYRGSGVQVDSVSFTAYPGYNESDPAALDVGVVITGDDLQRPAVPLLLSRDAKVGEQAVIAGWGLDQNDVGTTLRAGLTTVTAVTGAYLQTQFATPGGSTSGVCNGDSGGPLLLSQGGAWAIAGVTSATNGTACRNDTNFFANLRNASIRSFIANLVPGAIVR